MTYRKTRKQARTLYRLGWVLLIALLWTAPARAQLTVGENVSMNLAGSLGFGYSGGFGSQTSSSHGQSLSGDGYLKGSYYHPNFLSFEFHPYYDRSQSNAASAVIAHDTGFDAGVNLFSGSYFPGSISYGRAFSSSNEFGLPGAGGLVAEGSGQAFNISWAELLPGYPSLYANFGINSNSYSVLGTEGENHNSSKNFNLNSNYRLAGWDMAGSFGHFNQSYDSPSFLGLVSSGKSSSTSYGFNAQHRLPLHGSFGAGMTHSSYESSNSGRSKGSNTSLNAGVGFLPWSRLSINASTYYTSNLTAALAHNLAGENGLALVRPEYGSHSFRIGSFATLSLPHGVTIHGSATRAMTTFQGKDFVTTQYGGSIAFRYARPLLGLLRFSFGLYDHATKEGNSALSFVSTVGIHRRFGRWDTGADFGYSQDVQTLHDIATTSTMTYGGSVSRKINEQTYWSASFRGGHSGLVRRAGSSNATESFSTNFTWKRYGFGAGYGQSRGTSVLTPSGLLTPAPEVPLITDDFLLFNGRSLSVSATVRLLRRFVVTGSYAKTHNESLSNTRDSVSGNQIYYVRAEYKLRKLSLIGGFNRIEQEISTSPAGPIVVNSYYVRLSRWFNIF